VTGRPPRVLYLAHTLAVGGAEEMILNLLRSLPARFERGVMCIDGPGPMGEEIRRAGLPIESLGLQPGLRRPFDLLRLQRALEAAQPTIVHTFLLTASLYGRFAAMLARVPIVIGTEVNIYERKQAAHRLAERWLMQRTDAVIASAESVREFYIQQVQADPDKVVVIHNGVEWSQLETSRSRAEMRAEAGVPADVVAAVIIARLTEQKAHRVLFEAMASRAELSGLHLMVVGDGELRDELPRQVERLGLRGRVHFLGARRDLGNLLGAADLFVMPSLWEGLPLSLVLAMGSGLPVAASRVAGIPEVVEDGVTGLLVAPGQVPQLAAALVRLTQDPALRETLGARARAFVRSRFGVEQYVTAMTSLYDRLIDARTQDPRPRTQDHR